MLVLGCRDHLVPKYSRPDAEFEGRAGKMTTPVTCIDFDAAGNRLAIAAEYDVLLVGQIVDGNERTEV